jgi:pimeloyl-ACP methyl ester carboxylesterase
VDEQQVTVDGQQIAFTQSPGDGHAVIFVHGNSSSARTWQAVMTGPFGQRFRCLALNLPGHGSSAPATIRENYSMPGYAAVFVGFAKACSLASARVGSPTRSPSSAPSRNP